jgi:hypothetical protein
MKPPLRSLFASVVLTLGIAGCQPPLPPLTPQEQAIMQTLTHAMTPRCIGRYVIDLPAGMVPSGWGGLKAQGVNIEVTPMNESLFQWRYEQREAELRAAHLDAHPDQPVLKEIIPLHGAIGGIFNRSETAGTNGSRTLELLGWRDGYAVKMWVNAFDNMYPEYKNEKWATEVGRDLPEKQALLLNVFARTRGRADAEMPSEQGLCFHGGFLQGPATDEETWIWTMCLPICRMCRYRSPATAIWFRKIRYSIAARISRRMRGTPVVTRYGRASANSMEASLSKSGFRRGTPMSMSKAINSRWKPIAVSAVPRRRSSISTFRTAGDSASPTSAHPAPYLWTVHRR